MLERDYRIMAMQLATQLPDDKDAARRVHAFLGELIENWIFNDGQARLRVVDGVGAEPSSNITRLSGKPDLSPL